MSVILNKQKMGHYDVQDSKVCLKFLETNYYPL
jgi:hypothetical protein